MKYGRYKWSFLLMNWGLGITFLWIGVDMFQNPDAWIGYIPEELPFNLTRESALTLAGAFDIAVGVLFLMQWWTRTVALIAAAHLAAVLMQQGINAVVVRDIGLIGTALALFMWPVHQRRKNFLKKLFKRKRRAPVEYEE